MQQTYDISRSYEFNYGRGPLFLTEPLDVDEGGEKTFLGCRVGSRLGIAAGLLLNSKWIQGYAERGFDILTYKTVRSGHRPCYDLPNWVFVEEPDGDGPAVVVEALPKDPSQISSAVCFGMPSMAPEVWREDIRRTREALGKGKMLIVSVVATPGEGEVSVDAVAEDFRRCAEWAVEAGAHAIEANFSCPNVCSAEGTIYQDAKMSGEVAAAIRRGIGSTPLLIKCGHVGSDEEMRSLLGALAEEVDGVTLVNGLVRPVLHADGRPAFGERYRSAGVLGRGIHAQSVEDVRRAVRVNREEGFGLSVAAVGGVSSETDVEDFMAAGADAVLMGSSPMYLPDLAAELKQARPEW